MNLDDEVCLCFHVSQRKVLNYLRIEKPKSTSQLSECFGAGTGCGWCRPFLRRLFEMHRDGESSVVDPAVGFPSADDYASQRQTYVQNQQKPTEETE